MYAHFAATTERVLLCDMQIKPIHTFSVRSALR